MRARVAILSFVKHGRPSPVLIDSTGCVACRTWGFVGLGRAEFGARARSVRAHALRRCSEKDRCSDFYKKNRTGQKERISNMLDAYDHAQYDHDDYTTYCRRSRWWSDYSCTGVVTSAEGGSAGMRLSIETTTGTDRIGASERRGLRLSHAGTRARVATMDCVRRGVFPARGGLLSPRTSPSRERVHATSLPNDDRARIAGCTPASRVGVRQNAMSKPTWFRGGGLWDAYLALRAQAAYARACAR